MIFTTKNLNRILKHKFWWYFNYKHLNDILKSTFIKFYKYFNKKTPLITAIEIQNKEIVKILLSNEKIDINHKLIITN